VFSSDEFTIAATSGFPPGVDEFEARSGNPWQKTLGNTSIQPGAGGTINLVGPRVLTISTRQDVLDALDFIAPARRSVGTEPD